MQNNLMHTLTGLLNLPDLIILAILLVNFVLGCRKGLFGSLCGLAGRVAALCAAFFAARAAAPAVARWVVSPIVGEVFERQAALSGSDLLESLRQTVTEAAVSMAESIAFLLLLILFCILFGWLVMAAGKSLHFIAHLTPLGILDSLAGGAIGLAAGVLLVVLVLIGVAWFSPITYTSLGWLSPQRVEHSILLKALLGILPLAI